MITDKLMTEALIKRYESSDMDSHLDKDKFKVLYKEAVKDYYRFEPCEWRLATPKSDQFQKVQDYLKQNSLRILSDISDYMDGLSEEATA